MFPLNLSEELVRSLNKSRTWQCDFTVTVPRNTHTAPWILASGGAELTASDRVTKAEAQINTY